jgi:high-affinity iron transporter
VTKLIRGACILAFLFALISPVIGMEQAATAQEPSQDQAVLASSVKSGLTSAQRDLMLDDIPSAQAGMLSALDAANALSPLFVADPTAATDLNESLASASKAIAAGNDVEFAVAKGLAWSAILRGAMEETLAAAQSGDAAATASWLLIREFRPTTKFSRPGANATLAVQSLKNGDTSPEEAVAAIRADLLDTYQARLDAALSSALTSARDGYPVSQAESAATAAGYWKILNGPYESQRDATARADADSTFNQLVNSVISQDSAAFTIHEDAAATIVESFRATPMSTDEQASRAHQLLLYLPLVSVEYGRGVKGDQVTVDIEMVESLAFLDAARAAFADLRSELNGYDQATTDAVATSLATLNDQIQSSARKENVTSVEVVKSSVNDIQAKLKGIYPDAWNQTSGTADFEVISSILDQMETAVAAGQYKQAESARLQAYAIYDAGPEKHLIGFAPGVAREAEQLFWQGTGNTQGLQYAIENQASPKEIAQIRATLNKVLADGQERLGAGRPGDGAIVFNAATIVFREGLEAVLILASLLASMKGANAKFKRPMAVGAIGAFVATAVLFVLARSALLQFSQYGERLEAIVSIVAIGVLLLVMNWFFHKVYWTKWIAHHHTRRRVLIGGAAGQMLGLVILGFTSIFREGAETVLFLQALVLDAGTLVVIQGVAIGLVGTFIVGALVFFLQARLPHKKMLTMTGVMIAVVLVMMVGNTVHVLQTVGWMPITPIGNTVFPYWLGVWFGAYATWEGVVLQAVAVIFVIGSYFVAEWQHERSIQQRVAASEAAAAMPESSMPGARSGLGPVIHSR